MGTFLLSRNLGLDFRPKFVRGKIISCLSTEAAHHFTSTLPDIVHPPLTRRNFASYYPTMGDFEKAVDDISNKVNKTMTDDELEEIYALYKQATVGDINVPRPGMLDFKGKAKWDAWNTKKGMAQDKAKEEYIAFSKKMLEKHGTRS